MGRFSLMDTDGLMMSESLTLIEPSFDFEQAFHSFCKEIPNDTPIWGIGSMDRNDFHAAVKKSHDHASGKNLPDGMVPATTLWLIRNKETMIATAAIRHVLNERLLYEGGHIGYCVRPSERRKGYGQKLLALLLHHARNLGLQRVLLTCAKSNIASARVIQKNGGVLENEVEARYIGSGIKQRYWIEL